MTSNDARVDVYVLGLHTLVDLVFILLRCCERNARVLTLNDLHHMWRLLLQLVDHSLLEYVSRNDLLLAILRLVHDEVPFQKLHFEN